MTQLDLPFRLSVLDQSPIPSGSNGGVALRNSIELAKRADSLGYFRYWLAEHHGTPGLACTAPEIMIGQVAAATKSIRVGSGGIMLPHYSPMKVAENFSMLAGLFPDRIDLGIGRAAGTDSATSFALQRDKRQVSPNDFPEQLAELLGYFDDPPTQPLRRATILPGGNARPEPWLLGSSPQSAVWAAELGLPYVFADFINPNGASIAKLYGERFDSSRRSKSPNLGVAVWAICAESQEEAEALASSFKMMMTLMHRGQLIAVPTVEVAQKFLAEHSQLPLQRRIIVGTPDVVRVGIEAVAAEYEADEVLLVNILYDHAARVRSYELIADAFSSDPLSPRERVRVRASAKSETVST